MTARSFTVEVSDQQSAVRVARRKLAAAARTVLAGERIGSGEISIAVVDDPTIHELNRRYLQHDYPTDVLSFVLERGDGYLEGEVIVSAETAVRNAAEYGWSVEAELLLYVVHGTLHLAGYDDATDDQKALMRALERRYLSELGIEPHERPAEARRRGAAGRPPRPPGESRAPRGGRKPR